MKKETITERIVRGRMEKLTPELEMSLRMSGKTFESVTLGLGDTTLQREVFPDSPHGDITISTQEDDDLLGTSATYRRYILANGNLVPDAQFGERTVSKLRITTVLAKVAFGRVDHWDRESDFYETITEDSKE